MSENSPPSDGREPKGGPNADAQPILPLQAPDPSTWQPIVVGGIGATAPPRPRQPQQVRLSDLPAQVADIVRLLAERFLNEASWPTRDELHVLEVEHNAGETFGRLRQLLTKEVSLGGSEFRIGLQAWALKDTGLFDDVFSFAHSLVVGTFEEIKRTKTRVVLERIQVANRWSKHVGDRRLLHLEYVLRNASLVEDRPNTEWAVVVNVQRLQAAPPSEAELLIHRPDLKEVQRLLRTVAATEPAKERATVGPGAPNHVEEAKSKQRSPTGTGVELRREATRGELTLAVDDYADVLATVLSDADDEVCFALYGVWGRGKTTLARRLCGRLDSRHARPEYRTVWLNAWKYRSPPEIWAHLYESLVEAFRSDGLIATVARTARASLARMGLWPVTFAYLTLALTLVPVAGQARVVWTAATFLGGALGVVSLWALLAVSKTGRVVHRIWRLYGTLPSHQDKLGLQAAIGADLRSLLRGWIPRTGSRHRHRVPGSRENAGPSPPGGSPRSRDAESRDDRSPNAAAVAAFFGSVALVAAAIAYGFARPGTLSSGIVIGVPAAWAGLCVGAAVLVRCGGRAVDRVLLVVDDLDRCAIDQMLEVIEAIKLLIEEPGVRETLQLLVLVDEEVLSRAIDLKYGATMGAAAKPDKRRRLVVDHLRKLFLGHLRLGPLSSEDMTDLMERLVGNRSATAAPTVNIAKAEPAAVPARVASPREAPEEGAGLSSTSTAESGADVRFTDAEVAMLIDRCQQLLSGPESARVGPRTVRSLVTRYQLARLLLTKLGLPVDPARIAQRLVAPIRGEELEAQPSGQDASERVLDQVV